MEKEFIIDRSKWRCGDFGKNAKGLGLPQMLNAHGFQCCLGQIYSQLGFPDSELLGKGDPGSVNVETFLTRGNKNSVNTKLALEAININDDSDFTQKQRETFLIDSFKKEGYKISFINKTIKA